MLCFARFAVEEYAQGDCGPGTTLHAITGSPAVLNGPCDCPESHPVPPHGACLYVRQSLQSICRCCHVRHSHGEAPVAARRPRDRAGTMQVRKAGYVWSIWSASTCCLDLAARCLERWFAHKCFTLMRTRTKLHFHGQRAKHPPSS